MWYHYLLQVAFIAIEKGRITIPDDEVIHTPAFEVESVDTTAYLFL